MVPTVQLGAPVTLWFRLTRDGWELNHLEDGHTTGAGPTPRCPTQQAAWSGGRWAFVLGRLHAGRFQPELTVVA